MNAYTGGCSCGAVRYESRVDPQYSFHCQCRQCQKASGAGHTSQFIVPENEVTVSGELRFFEQKADSGNTINRGFCPACGSPVLAKNSGYPEALFIHAGSLDDPGLFRPQRVVWRVGQQPWDYIDPNLPAV